MRLDTVFVVVALAVVAGCKQATSQASPAAAEQACVADTIGSLQLLTSVPTCSADDLQCRARCAGGSAASCLGLAYAAEQKPDPVEARRLYRRACELGAANGCTNQAASLWAREHGEDELACIRHTFEKACSAREPFACGMVGRVMIESTDPPAFAEGKRYLEAACTDVGGFSCRVLAKHLESGKLGQYPGGRIRTLLARACDTGDPDACGQPATAAETFR